MAIWRRRVSRIAWTALATFSVAFLLFVYTFTEGIGVFSGLWWKSESNCWTITRPEGWLLVNAHLRGAVRPQGLTIRNTGATPLVSPFVTRDGISPWLSFDAQARAIAERADTNADRAALLVDWVRRYVFPEACGTKAQDIEGRPWPMMHVLGCGECDDLCFLVAMAARSVGLKARTLDLDGGHAVVEIFYDDGWHVFDPMYGYAFYDDDGVVPSFERVRAAGGKGAWNQADRPWLFARLTDRVWQSKARPVERDIPPQWRKPPVPLVLAPGDEVRFRRVRHRELFAGRGGGKNAFVSRVDLDLSVTPNKFLWEFPFRVLKATITAGPDGPTTVLADYYDRPAQAIHRFKHQAAAPWPPGTRLLVEAMAASGWIPVPDPGLTALSYGWAAGDRAEVTLRWMLR
ncbi:MAG: transglutaminase-like domain-containing protein [Candidatus Lernaella stagnicola]|nr:transglutaminase-like domain-containing protein [Candidatus Lernaella stagnicola]